MNANILIVDDEPEIRSSLGEVLSEEHYACMTAANGEEALEVINATEQKIDLIVTDVVMPGMDGHTFVRLVRQELSGVKVILVSGYSEDAIAGDIERDPSIHFLPKPYSLQELAGKTKEVLSE